MLSYIGKASYIQVVKYMLLYKTAFDMNFEKKCRMIFKLCKKMIKMMLQSIQVTVLTRQEREQGKERHFFVQSLVLESARDSIGGHLILQRTP